jgi:putative ATPase
MDDTLFDMPAGHGRDGSASDATPDLFDAQGEPESMTRPLAVRMRPRSLDEVIGQDAALAPGSPLRQLAQPVGTDSLASPSSVILFGPPGVGKTTLATIVAHASGRAFEQISAVTSGVKEVREVLARARRRLVTTGTETVLFVDEVHRFSKSQQDALLPAVENRDVTFLAATTENPSFSVISPLLSRSVVVRLSELDAASLSAIVTRALTSPRGLKDRYSLTDGARDEILRLSGGDARKALTILESAAGAVDETTPDENKADRRTTSESKAGGKNVGGKNKTDDGAHRVIDADAVSEVMQSTTLRYDKKGDDHYDVASAFIKSMRGSDPDAAVHYLARMIRAGEDPRFIARRIMIAASEEVGMASPEVLELTVAAAQAVAMVGMPEARIILSQAAIAVATAPKSNASYLAINKALEDVDNGRSGQVPRYLRNAPTKLMASWGNHAGYRYAHDWPEDVAPQEYLPESLRGTVYYEPKERGYEAQIRRRLAYVRTVLHADTAADGSYPAPGKGGADPTPANDPRLGRWSSAHAAPDDRHGDKAGNPAEHANHDDDGTSATKPLAGHSTKGGTR